MGRGQTEEEVDDWNGFKVVGDSSREERLQEEKEMSGS